MIEHQKEMADISLHNGSKPTGIQTTWRKLKDNIVDLAKERSKTVIAPLDEKIKELNLAIKLTLNDKTMDEKKRAMTAGILGEELKLKLMQKHNGKKREPKQISTCMQRQCADNG